MNKEKEIEKMVNALNEGYKTCLQTECENECKHKNHNDVPCWLYRFAEIACEKLDEVRKETAKEIISRLKRVGYDYISYQFSKEYGIEVDE